MVCQYLDEEARKEIVAKTGNPVSKLLVPAVYDGANEVVDSRVVLHIGL